jgi:hypothetical protein
MAKLFTIDKSFRIIEEVFNINTFLDLNDSTNNFVIMPLIFTKPALYREMIKMIYDTYIKDKSEINPFVFVSSIGWHNVKNRIFSKNVIDDFVKMHQFCSFIFNSSIWIHYVEIEISNGKVDVDLTKLNCKKVTDTIQNLRKDNCFRDEKNNNISIFQTSNAKENIDYQFRLQHNNYLPDIGAHGKNITPFLFSNEYQSLVSIENINKKSESNKIEPQFDKPELFTFNNSQFNILLVDDKMGKGQLIENLLNLDYFNGNQISQNTVWNEGKVVCRFFKKGCTNGIVKAEDDEAYLLRIEDFAKDSNFKDHTKIFHVTSIRDAILLLSTNKIGTTAIRFDLIMLDYLLDYKDCSKTEREYSSHLFAWFTNKKNDSSDSFGLGKDKNLIQSIKNNRGPMQKLWIFPITAFNQTFIDDLRNQGVRLIDYYWYLSRGADPINTPFLFINTLNNFLQLQLKQAVFSMEMLVEFLNRTLIEVCATKSSEDFQAFMGAEYTVLIRKFGWRPVIYRDMIAGSLFAKYVWDNFYSIKSNRILFRLLDLIQKLYQSCAYGEINDTKEMRNNLTELKVYIIDKQENIRKFLVEEQSTQALKVTDLDKLLLKINLIKPA